MTKRYIIRVFGRVQGVYFRGSARDTARHMGIKGFVRNEPDGSVYLEAEAEVDILNGLVRWCRHGPPHAQVDNIRVEEAEIRGYKGFDARY